MTDPRVLSEMPESATQPQLDTPPEAQPVIIEPRPAQEPPPARFRVSRSALLLIGGPLAGALIVWLAISTFSSSPTAPPEAVAEQAAPQPAMEAQPAVETLPAAEESVASTAAAEPAPAEPAPAVEPAIEPAIEPAVDPAPAVDPEPRQSPDASLSALNEVTPNVPQSALDTISGTVRVSVRVTVDNDGKVVEAAADNPGPSRYFERLAIGAAKKWSFAPADSAEQRTVLLKFNFTRDGVTAQTSAG